MRPGTVIVHGQIPWAIEQYRIRPGMNDFTVTIDDLKGALTDRRRGAVSRWHVTDQNEAAAQHSQRRTQPRQRARKEHIGRSGGCDGAGRVKTHDGRARPLNTAAAIEVGGQNIALPDLAASGKIIRNKRDTVGVDLSVHWYRRGINQLGNERIMRLRVVHSARKRHPRAEQDGGNCAAEIAAGKRYLLNRHASSPFQWMQIGSRKSCGAPSLPTTKTWATVGARPRLKGCPPGVYFIDTSSSRFCPSLTL